MAEMNGFARWMVVRRTQSRARRVLSQLGGQLQISGSQRVLELGSGGGGLIAQLQDRFHPAGIVGTDYDPRQVEATRELLGHRFGTIPSTIELRQADASQLPFPDSSFDFVFALQVLHHVETHHNDYVNRPRAIAEVRRVLRPGGAFVYSDMFRRDDIRRTLADQGYTQQFLRHGWRTDLAIFRSPSAPAAGASPPTETRP